MRQIGGEVLGDCNGLNIALLLAFINCCIYLIYSAYLFGLDYSMFVQ